MINTASKLQPVEKLSRERPLGNIFNFYVLLSVLLQFGLHIATLVYITNLSYVFEPYVSFGTISDDLLTQVPRRTGPIDLEAKFAPSLLNTAIYLLGLSQQVSTFTINFQVRSHLYFTQMMLLKRNTLQGRPFREGIRENKALWYGLLGASAVAFSGATDLMPELNRWLQIVEMEGSVSAFSTSLRRDVF